MRSRLLIEWLLVAGLAVFSLCLLVRYDLTARSDNLAYDAIIRARPSLASDVVIIAIDAPSLATVGDWPWRRNVHTALIARLAAAHPRAIGYDVLFVEPTADDPPLARAIGAARNVVLPLTFSIPGLDGAPFDLQPPVPPIARQVRAVGHADLVADADGIVRRVSLIAGTAAQLWPHFAEEVERVAAGRPSRAFAGTSGDALPADHFGLARTLLIPFSGPVGYHSTVSAGAVLRGEVPPELLQGKILLVGSTASGLRDQYPVSSGTMPGVEILANIVDALQHGRTIRPLGPTAVLGAALVPLFVLLFALLVLPPRINVVLGLALMAATVGISAALLLWADVWLPPTAALAGLLIVYPLWAWRRLEAANAYMVEELTQLQREADALPMSAPRARLGWFREAIARQTALLHLAIGRVRDLRRFFADSLQALPDATLVTDAGGEVLVANRAADALFGPSAGRALPQLLGMLAPALADQPALDGAREIATEDGRTFVLALVPLADAEGMRVGSIARLTDITEIRLATRQREDALQLLTHDMRSPQASILALLDGRSDDPPTLHARIAGYARRTLKLADDFVQYARAQSAQQGQELLDFAALLVEAADDQWALAQAKYIRIEAPDGDEEEYLVRGDRSLLARMLCNLIGNAIKYSGNGTVIRCSLERIAAEGGSPILRCDIADQGQGIPADELETIFRPFQRARDAGESGAGLGLAFVRAVVQRHGGTIAATSIVGEGTTFSLELPIAEDE